MSGPQPPLNLASRQPELITLAAGSKLYRFYTAAFEPVYFDRSNMGRLNAPDASYGVLYTAAATEGAFAETFLREPGRSLIDLGLLHKKAHVVLENTAPLKLAKLAGRGLAILGATAEVLHSGLPYDASQNWSKALHNHPEKIDGIAYYARHDDEQLCYALFDHCAELITIQTRQEDLDKDWFWQIANHYNLGIAPY
ncbi:RES family NAD+ phosphorylase [Pseudochrobactrum kiredjianiae]|uniref:RES family NAD+ phosphorylase n=1 Tax=Pseudochrobactrum kiredjianiae TaxID=386305 RepID=A0ABW3V3M8_9HYPH|nr:RES family NAD+ phosphorylase [Pseudochrobactrum kiredjianiae]MDM7850704.1 RES family NAD+ phosphorylase [Pseudochrobactrum kiredjianiae]